MTSRADPLFVSEKELAARLGFSCADWKAIAPKLERLGLPLPDPIFGGRRYWPAVREYLDRRHGLRQTSPTAKLGPTIQGSLR